MAEPSSWRRSEPLRDKQRIILLCAPVTLLFTFADTLALKRFSWTVFGVRALWSALIAGSALALSRVGPAGQRRLMMGVAVSAAGFFGVLTWMTGGFGSPLYHWILAMPLVIAVVLQEYPRATLAAAVATLVAGVAITALAGQPLALIIEWLVQATGMSALAVYASITYRRLRGREQALREAGLLAEERARGAATAVRARDQFLSVASHELKTPLTALTLQLERLARRLRAGGNAQELLPTLERQADRLTELVDTLLDVSRIASGQLALERGEGDLTAAVRQAVERYAPLAQRQGCVLGLEAEPAVTAVFDPARLEQVLANLIGNAVKFGAGRPITLTVARRDGQGVISVRDGGPGIAAADQNRIFDRFERAASERNYGGLGLGLWICRRIVEEMQGSISVDSRPGEGATFTVALPTAAQAATG